MTEHVRYWTPQWQPTRAAHPARTDAPRASGHILALTPWEDAEQALRRAVAHHDAGATLHVVRAADQLVPALRTHPLPGRILIWHGPAPAEDAGEVEGAHAAEREYFLLHELTQALLRARPEHDVRLVHAFTEGTDGTGGASPRHAAVGAFARVVALEKPTFDYRSVALTPRSADDAAATLLAEFDRPREAAQVRYDGEHRTVRGLAALPAPPPATAGPGPVRPGATYLITGGLGGLGLIFARELARRAPVRLVLSGRRPLDERGRAALAQLASGGTQARYVQADVSSADGVATLVSQARGAFGPLAGVVHSAGVIQDSFLLKKTHEEAAAVLAAKVRGTALLDAALRDEPLDFFVLFSSLAGTLGNLGQADYGFANAYLDQYAHRREALRRRGLRSGRSLAIGWPLWQGVGAMHAADGAEERARDELGLHPLTAGEGVDAFFTALTSDAPQVVVVKGEPRTWEALERGPWAPHASARQAAPASPGAAAATEEADPVLRGRTRDHLVRLISRYTKLPSSEIRPDTSFGRYGVESILIIGMTQELEEDLGPLAKTLFFEYDSVNDLTDHLVRTRAPQLRAHFGLTVAASAEPAPHPAPAAAPEPTAPAAPARALSGKWALLQARGRAEQPAAEPSAAGHPAADHPVAERSHPVASRPAAQRETAQQDAAQQDIAIIGLAGRYPGADDLDAFWENLRTGTDSVTEVPPRRWDHSALYAPERGKPGTTYSRWGGFLDGVELFDPLFFNIPPVEAEFLDPQERLFLETSYQTIEDAGYAPDALAGKKVGVYAGVMFGLYQLLATDKHGGWLNGNSSYASVANRVSYFFDFHGPSMTVDTMCSSSLVAIHQACTAIRSGECELALAGGVNVMSHPAKYIQLGQGGFLSSDGRCRAFGEGGDGYVPGEGVGAVLLKPLRQALADGDHVHAVIKGSAVNAGGRTSGYSVPNPQAQAEVIGEALARADVDPRSVSYVEAHGTGTSLGDPIEITGLTKAYRRATQDQQFCAIGSVKSNIGHLESAAGIAALTKVILQMRHRQLVPSLHTTPLNPLIDFPETPFTVQSGLQDWQAPVGPDGRGLPRRAGVSAFGAGGTNAHLVVEEPPAQPAHTDDAPREHLFVLSAQQRDGLRAAAQRLLTHLDRQTDPTPADRPAAEIPTALTPDAVREETRAAVAHALGLRPADVADDEPYADQGLGAYELVACHERLQERLGLSFPTEVLHERPTVARTAAHLADLCGARRTPEPAARPAAAPALSLADLAYTLQTGRAAMAERLAVRAGDLAELRQGLRAYLEGHADAPGVWSGSTEDHDRRLHSLLRHDVTQKYTRQLLAEGRLDETAEMWVMGADADWAPLWQAQRRRRLPLPTYPFARETHWVIPVGPDDPLVPATALAAASGGPVAVPAVAPAPALPAAPRPAPAAAPVAAPLSGDELHALVLADVKRRFSDVLKIPVDRLKAHSTFEDYGVDSVRITQLNRALEAHYGPLPTSLLFTYKDLESLARHLATTSAARELGAPAAVATTPAPLSPAPAAPPAPAGAATAGSGDIAIIGLSGRYPQAPTLAEFAANLAAGRDAITEIPAERWDHRDFPDVDCRWGGFLDDALAFDPGFFNLSPGAAAYMDPQERLFLQAVWHCLEDAGHTPESLADPEAGDRRGNVAVFAGVTFNEYGLYGAADLAAGKDVPIDSQLYSVANRVSYLLNLRGPSLVVDTACSSSLYAIHLACEALRHGEAEVAIAGGVNLSLHPSKYLTLGMFNFLSADGHCKSFGEGGNGYVPGEGVGAVLLKPLAQAEADGDHVYGVVKGTAVNHGGKTNGYTVPNPVAQAEVVRAALARAGVEPGGVSYLEAHGTGTSLGDSIEIEALATAFDGFPDDGRHCAIGSVKSNIGHLEAAAGISQVTKVLLQMREGRLFPSRLNSERLNPEIDFDRTPFRVQLEAEPWQPPQGQPRRAGVSSFGVGGVNVHLVLEEYTGRPHPAPATSGPHLVPLSARTPEALVRYAAALHAHLDGAAPDARPDLADVAYTLQTGRRPQRHRVAFSATDHADLAAQLKGFVADGRADAARERLDEAGRQWLDGADVDFEAAWRGRPGRRVSLPGYPFERDTHWLYEGAVRVTATEPAAALPATADAEPGGVDHAFLGQLAEAFRGERPELMAGYLQHRVAGLLGFADGRLPETDRGFFELGMDSITSTQMHNLLERLFGQSLDLQLIFNYPTINDVAAYLLDLLDQAGDGQAAGERSPAARAADDTDAPVWLFTRDWVETHANAARQAGGTVVLLDTGEKLRSALLGLPVGERPEHVILVRPGERGFHAVGPDEFELDPLERDGYERLLAALAERDLTVDRIIHHWSAAGSDADPDRIEAGLHQGVYALTALSQAVLAKLPGQRVRLVYAYASRGGAAAPESQGIGGFARAARMESPLLVYKTVEFTRANLSRARMAAALMAEFGHDDADVELRHSGTRRWARCFHPVPAGEIEAAKPRFTAGGVYLITGGPGGLAGLFARYLSEEHRARVVLVGRRAADAEKLAELASWGRDGGEAVYLRADIGDRQAVADLVAEVRGRFGPITGLIHSAGALRDGSLQNKRPKEMAEVFRAKVFGTRYLDEALRDEPLELFVMFSSLAAVLGNFGQSDYCFANSYLDAFAEYRAKQCERGERAGHTLSLNWSFWRTGGMETSETILTWMRNTLGTVVLEGPEGWQALRTGVGLDHPQVVTVKGDIAKITRMLGVPAREIEATLPVGAPTEGGAEPPAGAASADGAPAATRLDGLDGLAGVADPEGLDAASSDLDGMGEDDLVALLRKEIELSENEGLDVS
ncbi:SDR family NAD(P)-dependent oxidoreductase [Streptomyces buecherae]|uniref:SDR family NAD(P)-dependent oxidoreductase n=1 Tax=Streptomyces buecherae TaxID=2763006 RepID=UPI0033C9B7EA